MSRCCSDALNLLWIPLRALGVKFAPPLQIAAAEGVKRIMDDVWVDCVCCAAADRIFFVCSWQRRT